MKNSLTIEEIYKAWVLLTQTRDAIIRVRDKELSEEYGIRTIEAAALFYICCIGNKATPSEISRWMLRKPHTVSILLGRMEKKGLITRTKDLQSKNLVRVSLTEKGRKIRGETSSIGAIGKIFSTLSEEECHQLMSILEKLRKNSLRRLKLRHKPPFPPE